MDPVVTPMVLSTAAMAEIAITVETAQLISAAIITAATIGASYGLQQLQEDDDKKRTNEQVTIRQPIPSRVRGYGTVKLGGALVFADVTPSVTLTEAIVHCQGPIRGVTEWWLNDKKAAIAPNATGVQPAGLAPWFAIVKVETHLGTAVQAADATLIAGFPSIWTSNHTLSEVCYSVISYGLPPNPERNLRTTYPSGTPSLRIVAQLSLVYDPRNSAHDPDDATTWEWSDNPSLCILDFLTHKDGMNLPLSRMNLDSFSAFANFCDETMVGGEGAGEKRWRLSGTYNLNEEARAVLRRMLATCDGELKVFPDGTVGIISSGLYATPSVTLTDDNVISYEYQQANDKLGSFNRLKFTFLSPDHDYQQVEGDPWDDAAAQAESGQVISQELPLPFVPSATQARRLAKIVMAKENPRHRFSGLVATLPALDLLGERVVQLTLSDLGVGGVFRITRYVVADDLTTVTMDLSSVEGTEYTWTVGDVGDLPSDVGTGVIVPVATQDRWTEDGQTRETEAGVVRETE